MKFGQFFHPVNIKKNCRSNLPSLISFFEIKIDLFGLLSGYFCLITVKIGSYELSETSKKALFVTTVKM